jgi:hypothetical protein
VPAAGVPQFFQVGAGEILVSVPYGFRHRKIFDSDLPACGGFQGFVSGLLGVDPLTPSLVLMRYKGGWGDEQIAGVNEFGHVAEEEGKQ